MNILLSALLYIGLTIITFFYVAMSVLIFIVPIVGALMKRFSTIFRPIRFLNVYNLWDVCDAAGRSIAANIRGNKR